MDSYSAQGSELPRGIGESGLDKKYIENLGVDKREGQEEGVNV
jgi:hypothetical protein